MYNFKYAMCFINKALQGSKIMEFVVETLIDGGGMIFKNHH
jgi:hypothetical protein